MKSISFKKPGMILGFLFFLVFFALGAFLPLRRSGANSYAQICHLVANRIYYPESQILPWLHECLNRSRTFKKESSVDNLIRDLNNQFSKLKTSHLEIYNSAESKKVWSGESAETGIEADYVEGELVIFKIHKNSPAEYAGLRMGDVIYRINDGQGTPQEAEVTSGVFAILRDKVIKEYKIQTKEIKRDEAIEIIAVSDKTAVVKIPSFRSEYFEKESLQQSIGRLRGFRKIIVDLRGNLGGNFVAGLRLLSSFMCSPQNVGYIWKPKSKLKQESNFVDDMDDERQIDVLDKSFLINLWTFDDYDCMPAAVAVLVDHGTASTAEMVAQALKDYVGAKIFGSASAGQLLVGVWYPLPELGPGVKISIPEAIYQTKRGHKIEGPGVQIDQTLYYHLSEIQNGEDSWVKHAVQLF